MNVSLTHPPLKLNILTIEYLCVDMVLSFFNSVFIYLCLRPADTQVSGGHVSPQLSQNSLNIVQPAGPSQGKHLKKTCLLDHIVNKLVASSQLFERKHVQTS